jgi:hypothetical protein
LAARWALPNTDKAGVLPSGGPDAHSSVAALQEFGLGISRAVAFLAAAAIAGAVMVVVALSGLGVL